MRNWASKRETQLTLGNGQLGDIVQQADGSAQEPALEVVRARARHLQPPSALGRRATDGDVPPAVEVLIVYGGAEAAKSQGCDESESHCAYFTKVYAGPARLHRSAPQFGAGLQELQDVGAGDDPVQMVAAHHRKLIDVVAALILSCKRTADISSVLRIFVRR